MVVAKGGNCSTVFARARFIIILTTSASLEAFGFDCVYAGRKRQKNVETSDYLVLVEISGSEPLTSFASCSRVPGSVCGERCGHKSGLVRIPTRLVCYLCIDRNSGELVNDFLRQGNADMQCHNQRSAERILPLPGIMLQPSACSRMLINF